MNNHYSFKGKVEKFPGRGGWTYIAVPRKYTTELKTKRVAWGIYPIVATIGNTNWHTKLMMKKGGNFFVALKASVRKKEQIAVGGKVTVSFRLL